LKGLGILAGVVLVAVACIFGIAYESEPLQDSIVHRVLIHMLDRNQTALFKDDALRAIVCGSGTPQPSIKAAKSCIAVIAGGKMYVVDTGSRSSSNLATWRLPVDRVAGVFLTHFHSDHIGDLGELNMQSWNFGRSAELQVYGPPGVEQVVAGFSQAYALDKNYRGAAHGVAVMALANGGMKAHTVAMPGQENSALDHTVTVLDDGALKVTAIEVNHKPVVPAYAYRFDYKGRSIVISGDTAFHPPLARAAEGADVLFHEAEAQHMMNILQQTAADVGQIRLSTIAADVQRYHSTTLQAAEISNRAHVKLLAIYHADPPVLNFFLERIFTRGLAAARQGDWLITMDGTLIELPLDSGQIHVGSIAQ
jgi:ribonuclease Z